MGRSVDEGKWAAWQRRLARYERGSHSVAAFCIAEGVSVPCFYQWKRKLAAESAKLATLRPGEALHTAGPTFLPVRIESAAVIEIELPNGVRVRVPSSDAAAISAVINAAGRVPAAGSAEAPSC
jgi:hypothetical protein